MDVKSTIKFCLIIGLILVAGYLTYSLVSASLAQQRDVNSFCAQKCSYNPSSLFWEFSGDNGTKGFTTKDECFSYCSKVKLGFAYVLESSAADFLGAVENVFRK